jgi:hypothetical protein
MAIEVTSIHKPRRTKFKPRIRVIKSEDPVGHSRARRILLRSGITLGILFTISLAFLIYSYQLVYVVVALRQLC